MESCGQPKAIWRFRPTASHRPHPRDTARQMEQTLHFDPGNTRLHELFGRLAAALKAAQGSNELSIANSMWPQEKYPFREEFLNLLNRDYGATVTPLNRSEERRVGKECRSRW